MYTKPELCVHAAFLNVQSELHHDNLNAVASYFRCNLTISYYIIATS